MKRPNIKDKEILGYVEYLEKQLENFKSDKTIAKSYLGIKNVVDQMNSIMLSVKLILEDIDEDGKSQEEIDTLRKEYKRQQLILSKALDVSDRIEDYIKSMEEIEKKVNASALAQVKKEMEAGSIYEEALKSGNENREF